MGARKGFRLIDSVVGRAVLIEKFKAQFPVRLGQVVPELVAARENVVELVVTEAYDSVVLYGASVIYLTDIRPHACAKAHVARLAGSIQRAAAQIVGTEGSAGLAYAVHLAVRRRIIVLQHGIVSPRNDFTILYYYGTERAAVMAENPLTGLRDRDFHIISMIHLFQLSKKS